MAADIVVATLMQTVKLLLLNRVTEVDLVNPDPVPLQQKMFVVRQVLGCVETDGKNIDLARMQQLLKEHKHALDVELPALV